MKVVHIESGLGNQMLSYCELLALRYCNPDEEIYIENMVLNNKEYSKYICQWNGYELERVFDIKERNISTLFTEKEWQDIEKEALESKIWDHNWNYPQIFTKIFAKHGLNIFPIQGDFEDKCVAKKRQPEPGEISYYIKHSRIYAYLKYYKQLIFDKKILPDISDKIFINSKEPIFAGQQLLLNRKNSGREIIDSTIRSTFIFPEIKDERNLKAKKHIELVNAVAIHARRGDMLGANEFCYLNGYFNRAVRRIKTYVTNPVFFIFCDPDSVQWAKDNSKILGLDFRNDEVHFVDWNKGEDSFRDMQLMGCCKHAIITNSSFGWWGAYFIENPNKITISPIPEMDTIYHC